MKKYLLVIEETGTGYSAYSPDLPGCIATGATRQEVEHEMREAMRFHIEGLRSEGQAVPEPHTYPAFCDMEQDTAALHDEPAVRYMDADKAKTVSAGVFSEHAGLFRKLAR